MIILDGTASSLQPNYETNAGKIYRLLLEQGPSAHVTIHYEAGIQWNSWGDSVSVVTGRGMNQQIERAYGVLASRYRPGDLIYLIGYSRGAFAVRSLAGIIEEVGLVSRDHANMRNLRTAFRHYRYRADPEIVSRFRALYGCEGVRIRAIGVFDTVKALGITTPVLHRFYRGDHSFHNADLGSCVDYGFQALALDETRQAFAPVLWETHSEADRERVCQMWFRGNHADIGGQLGGYLKARPLTNIPLVWMLTQLQALGLPLPHGWRNRFVIDATAPSVSVWSSWNRMNLRRKRRLVGADPSEYVHPTALSHKNSVGLKPGTTGVFAPTLKQPR